MSESLAEALAAFQADLPHIAKNDRATQLVLGLVVRADAGSYSYSYAGLPDVTAAVMPRLAEHGLSFVAKPTMDDGRFVLAYSLLHVSGEREDGSYPLPSNGTPQAIGSAITYARRYTLAAVTGVVPNDDDDGAAAERERSRPQRQEVEHLTDRQVAALDEIAQQPARIATANRTPTGRRPMSDLEWLHLGEPDDAYGVDNDE